MKTHIFLFITSVFWIPSYGDITDCEMSSKQAHYHLKNDLLCDYSYGIRPKINHQNATKIFVRMIVQSFVYDMYENTITVNNWMPMTWLDDHLKWTPSMYDDVELIHLSSFDIWTPDLALYNKYSQDSVERVFDSGVDCVVRYTGKVTCVPPTQHQAICTTDLRNYPYDTQTCALRLGSWVHSGEEIDFRFSNKPVTVDNLPMGEWKLLNVTTERNSGNYSCCPNNTYPSLTYIFKIQRLASYHEATIVVPAIAVIIMTLFVFSLNATENERFYMILVNILFHFLFIQNLAWELPKMGNTPNILLFARDSLILCIVQFTITLTLRRMIKVPTDNIGWVSEAIAKLIQSRVSQAILVSDNSLKAIAIAKGDEDGANIIEQSQNANNEDYIIFAKILDRLLCVIFVIIYITMFIRLVP